MLISSHLMSHQKLFLVLAGCFPANESFQEGLLFFAATGLKTVEPQIILRTMVCSPLAFSSFPKNKSICFFALRGVNNVQIKCCRSQNLISARAVIFYSVLAQIFECRSFLYRVFTWRGHSIGAFEHPPGTGL